MTDRSHDAAPSELDLAQSLVERARKAGADAADAVVIGSSSLGASCRLGELEEVERSESADLGLRVIIGGRQAAVSSTDFSEPTLVTLVERVVAMAKAAPEDPYCGLADPNRLVQEIADLDLDDGNEPPTETLVARAREAEDAARAVRGVTNSEGGSAGWARSRVALATSSGFAGAYASSSHSVSCSVLAGEGTAMERDYDYHSVRHLGDLDDAATIGRTAGERAVRRLNARKVDTQSVPIIYDPRVASSLLGHLAGAISGTSVARGTSFLKDSLETEVFAKGIRIVDDPARPRGLRSRPFDGEGTAGPRLDLIDDGRLTTWVLDSATGRQLGLPANGRASRGVGSPPSPGTTNLYMEAGTLSPAELMADIEAGLYVTEMIGMGVNGVTGDYSRGAGGFWIEKGELTYPVNEVTIAGNLKTMYRELTPANDLAFRYRINAPTLRVEGMTIAGT